MSYQYAALEATYELYEAMADTMRAVRGPLLDEFFIEDNGYAHTWNPLEFVEHVSGWFTYEDQWESVLLRAAREARSV